MSITRYDADASLENAMERAKERFTAARQAQADMPMYTDLYKEGRPYLTICAMPEEEGTTRRVITRLSSVLNPDAEARVMDAYGMSGPIEDHGAYARMLENTSLAELFAKGDPRVTEVLMVTFGSSHGEVTTGQVPYVRGFGAKTLFRDPVHLDSGTATGRVPNEISMSLSGVERDMSAPGAHLPASALVLALPSLGIVPDDFIMTLHEHDDWAQVHDFEGWHRTESGWVNQRSQWDDSLMIAPKPVLI